MTEIAYVMFRGVEPDGAIRTCTVLPAGRVDRSPCGTGSSANLACLHARGAVKVGDRRTSRSITGGEFTLEAIAQATVGGRPAIVPRITGGAWIYGAETLRIDLGDAFPKGFALSDAWGPNIA
jgi:proline racemase